MEIPNLKKANVAICQKVREPRINRKDSRIFNSGGDGREEVRTSSLFFCPPKMKNVKKARSAATPPAMMKVILHPIVEVR
jgi:hypothetical protein